MKLCIVFFLAATLPAFAGAIGQTVTFSKKNVSLEKVFVEIRKQTGYNFLYNDALLAKSKKVTVSAKRMPLKDMLDLIFSNQALTYSILDKTVVVKEDRLKKIQAPDPIKVTGSVKDDQGNPIRGASITVKGASKGVISDDEGRFVITVDENAELEISAVGYVTQIIKVRRGINIDITLEKVINKMDEVVVVGYGTQKRSNITGVVSSVSSETIGNQPVASAANALSGRVTGLQIVQGSAQPGQDAPVIQIRGMGTIRTSVAAQNADAGPLVLIDGVQSTMNDLNPNDIETFSILKDAASASIYGARGANGVILVTTKRGANRKPIINFAAYQAFQWATTIPQMLGIYDFARLKNLAQTNTGREPVYSDSLLNAFKNSSDSRFPAKDYSYFDDGYIPGAPLTNYYLSVRGGGPQARYLISGGYQDQEGIVLNTGSKRFNFRSNVDVTINSFIKAGLNLSGSYINAYEPNYGNYGVTQFIRDMIRYPPFVPESYANGFPAWGNAALAASPGTGNVNPIAMNKLGGRDIRKTYRATPHIYLQIEPLKDLVFRADASVFFSDTKTSRFNAPVTFSDGVAFRQNTYRGTGIGYLSNQDETEITTTVEATGRYSKKINRSNIYALVGISNINYNQDDFSAANEGYSSSKLTQLNAGTLSPSVKGVQNSWALSSLFSRLSYNFDEKYFIEGNIRYDGSSRFGSQNQFGTFPSVSFAWNIAREKFMLPHSWINDLKVRASWGQLGNQNIGNYASVTTIAYTSPYVFGNAVAGGAAQKQLGNPNVRWETSTSKNLGFDASLFKNSLSITADIYSRVSTDLLVTPPISAIFGDVTEAVSKAIEAVFSFLQGLSDHFQVFVADRMR